ncbi:DUF2911 domain-containing protein [Gramella sp. GC03-9]|uniref:DUF2911 domain-containing protein n=1 Tax=Christiangramia oceanisediminis TaxID=2920386 RepID=A0A9X2I9A2_9FLAO|nr:DUF2911 domain-containing protein [Gramella oceanisediminis]MCP9198348.1 DUF2911 domain-containing protein [Gramella oceanisediminis]
MNPTFKVFLKIAGMIVLLGLILFMIIRYTTKAHSPEDTVIFQKDELRIEIFYNRPYKKGREIFGQLVPYNEVWRTGANEATTFETNHDLLVDGSLLPAGKYTLWTIPMENSWKVIFNSEMYPWGIDMEEKAYRNPESDALVLERPVEKLSQNIDQFTILLEQEAEFINMMFVWDRTLVSLPLKMAEAPEGASVN